MSESHVYGMHRGADGLNTWGYQPGATIFNHSFPILISGGETDSGRFSPITGVVSPLPCEGDAGKGLKRTDMDGWMNNMDDCTMLCCT